jgi:prophage antirepressor-like protein
MQAIELSKQLFNGNEIRVFGTSERPLFVANDVAKVLGIKNINQAVSKFTAKEKSGVHLMDPMVDYKIQLY